MAFNRENLSYLTETAKNGVTPSKLFFYNESTDTVTATSYFVDSRLTVGDIIEVVTADFTSISVYRVSAVLVGKATVTILSSHNP